MQSETPFVIVVTGVGMAKTSPASRWLGATLPTPETVFCGLADFSEPHVEPYVLDDLTHQD